MINPVHSHGPGAPRPAKPETASGTHRTPSASASAPGTPASPEFHSRLGPIAARIEDLLTRLSGLRTRGEEGSSAQSILLHEINAAQVAFQNILSTDATSEDPSSLETPPAAASGGHTLNPGNVLQLLE